MNVHACAFRILLQLLGSLAIKTSIFTLLWTGVSHKVRTINVESSGQIVQYAFVINTIRLFAITAYTG